MEIVPCRLIVNLMTVSFRKFYSWKLMILNITEIVDHTYLGDKNKLLKKLQKKHYMVALFDLGQNG